MYNTGYTAIQFSSSNSETRLNLEARSRLAHISREQDETMDQDQYQDQYLVIYIARRGKDKRKHFLQDQDETETQKM